LTMVAPIPVEVRVCIVLEKILSFPAPEVMPVMVPALVIVLMLLLLMTLFGLVMPTLRTVIDPVPVPADHLVNVFPSMVLVTLPIPASVLIQPAMLAVPLMVMLEKSLLLLFTVTLALFVAVVLEYRVSAPDEAVLLKAVTILFEFTF